MGGGMVERRYLGSAVGGPARRPGEDNQDEREQGDVCSADLERSAWWSRWPTRPRSMPGGAGSFGKFLR
jgi:hypothetical protein